MAAFRLKAQVATEKQEHLCLMQWVALQPKIRDYLIHIANEYDGGAIGGFQRKRLGVKKGVSDLLLALPTKTYHGLWIELKRKEGGRVTEEQQDWVNKMNAVGYLAVVCRGYEAAVKVICDYLKT